MLFPALLEPTQILRNDELNNYYYKANQHLDLTFIVPLHFPRLEKSIILLWVEELQIQKIS